MMPELLTTVSPTVLLKVEGAGSHREGSHRKPETELAHVCETPPPAPASCCLTPPEPQLCSTSCHDSNVCLFLQGPATVFQQMSGYVRGQVTCRQGPLRPGRGQRDELWSLLFFPLCCSVCPASWSPASPQSASFPWLPSECSSLTFAKQHLRSGPRCLHPEKERVKSDELCGAFQLR